MLVSQQKVWDANVCSICKAGSNVRSLVLCQDGMCTMKKRLVGFFPPTRSRICEDFFVVPEIPAKMFLRLLSDVRWQRSSLGWWSKRPSRHSSMSGAEPHPTPLPAHARVVICGGGIMGTSVAYHLSKLGWKDIILLEQGRLAAGSTRFCAGIVSTARQLSVELKMADYSNKLYQQLEQETGVRTGYVRTGSVFLAQTQDRLISLKRIAAQLKVMGVPCEIISPKRVAQLHPLINIHDLVGALHVPEDAVVSSADVSLALASAAASNGVQIHERTSVIHVLGQKGCVAGVETDRGTIECQYFVNCAGQWAYELGLSNEEPVSIPLHACEHFHLLTRPWKTPLESSMPSIVDPDGRIYIRSWQGGILSGGFEKNPKPIFTEGRNQLEIHNLQEDWDHFEPLLSAFLRRMPGLEGLEIMQLVNCPESFTPDMRCIMGESPSIQGYFVLAGMNSAGTSFGGGAGKYLAEWMVNGSPSENVWPLDLKRFGALQSSRTFLRHRVMEVMPLIFDLKVPRWDFQTGRQLRTSPLYDRLDAQGARWMEKHGFERAKFFVPPGKDLLALDQSKTFYKPDWFDIVGGEVRCCKEAVCVIDMSSFTKFEISSTGDQALEVLQYLFSNDLDVPVGHIVHTGMLNHNGGYENDCSVVRLSKRRPASPLLGLVEEAHAGRQRPAPGGRHLEVHSSESHWPTCCGRPRRIVLRPDDPGALSLPLLQGDERGLRQRHPGHEHDTHRRAGIHALHPH
ncbi:pyruvate dehydrogenase phosphatase regulatory subunit, mitochondrial isoform X3 [Varanus komodoensis]|uniref:pyruvate dehydrogenase phosphatase regulatory subunit, mitochondrial isoform X3 n=1 Tax=Varanus komodoensis TaxID=61221 RepID=UPI001CF787D7|nr:pyruvate dehydrogenase phosphatase regulatory subunit, mitochondrial isoform X3 [Varanus komodoensis]XP_044290031.1 pyruvate dehydrogenase phosphatase regulatory subunit, mitochondrial isoform X3 [Varanus komodoensis]